MCRIATYGNSISLEKIFYTKENHRMRKLFPFSMILAVICAMAFFVMAFDACLCSIQHLYPRAGVYTLLTIVAGLMTIRFFEIYEGTKHGD